MDNSAASMEPLVRVERGRRQQAQTLLAEMQGHDASSAQILSWLKRLTQIVAAGNYALPEFPTPQQPPKDQ